MWVQRPTSGVAVGLLVSMMEGLLPVFPFPVLFPGVSVMSPMGLPVLPAQVPGLSPARGRSGRVAPGTASALRLLAVWGSSFNPNAF